MKLYLTMDPYINAKNWDVWFVDEKEFSDALAHATARKCKSGLWEFCASVKCSTFENMDEVISGDLFVYIYPSHKTAEWKCYFAARKASSSVSSPRKLLLTEWCKTHTIR